MKVLTPVTQGLHAPMSEYSYPDGKEKTSYKDNPARVGYVLEGLQGAGADIVYVNSVDDLVWDLLTTIHSSEIIDLLRADFSSIEGGMYLYPNAMGSKLEKAIAGVTKFYDVPFGVNTADAVLKSASSALRAVRLILDGERLAFAACRPPGHHAERGKIGGYCYINNAAMAASYLRMKGKRPAVIDIDYHCGNGTSNIFWNNRDVFVGSIHADPENHFPFTDGCPENGVDPEFTVLVELQDGIGGDIYLGAFDELLEEVRLFGPDVLVISAGFDGFKGDPLGTFNLEVDDFYSIARRISALNLPSVVVLEGGYSKKLTKLAEAFANGLK